MRLYIFSLVLLLLCQCESQVVSEEGDIITKRTSQMSLDGYPDDEDWQNRDWIPMDQVWLGTLEDSTDFKGDYKIAWSDKHLLVLARIVDDTLVDYHPDPLDRYWDDDCLEVFVDHNNSDGNHQYNHSAFAYHIDLEGNVMDIGPDSIPHYYNDHVLSKRTTNKDTTYWELAIRIYGEDYVDGEENKQHKLKDGQSIGFAIAYCDNDRSEEREAFIGSVVVEGEDKNKGWIDAGIFGNYTLK